MKKIALLAALVVTLLAVRAAMATERDRGLTLTSDGRSDYRIVIPEQATSEVRAAAQELRSYLRQISGAIIPIVTDDLPAAEKEIIVGRGRRLQEIRARVDWKRLGEEGFTIRTLGPRLIIVGGPTRGTLYGVYTFLEDHLGCRWYTPTASIVPQTPTVEIGRIDDTQVPVLEYRESYYREATDNVLAAHHKLNGRVINAHLGKDVGDGIVPGFLGWAHTIFALLPPEQYFESHPEYYALRDGVRRPYEPCWSNPDVFRIVVEKLRTHMAADPKQHYWSVSQMDNAEPCTCDACRAIDEREGTPQGSVLTFVNKVAAEFPDKTISTLAYWYTRKPPKTLTPAKNVHIVLCSIECNRSRPIATDPDSAGFRDDVVTWAKIAPSIFVWDYTVQFSSYLDPFPNLRVLQPNMQFFVKNGAKGMFAQGNAYGGGEFGELRSYLLAKLMWNPDCDITAIRDDFVRGFYGPAGESIRTYINELHDALERSGRNLSIYGGPADQRDGCLSAEMMARYETLFDQAERAVSGDPTLLLRVQRARMPIMLARLQLGYGSAESRLVLARRLLDINARAGGVMYNEGGAPLATVVGQIIAGLETETGAKTELP